MSNPAVIHNNGLEIAIIGMAGRFPGAKNIAEFWRNLREGVESISFFTDEELESVNISPGLINDPAYVKAAGVLEDIDKFDAAFFNYSPREAEVIDPQHRIFLECAAEALENAGYDPESGNQLIGVYAGTGMGSYLINLCTNQELLSSVGEFQIALGMDKDHLATRVSYKLNLEGPSVTVQTACSTSLVAVHLACQALLNGECDIALAGGVTVKTQQKGGYLYREGGILSPDGHCRAFDTAAQGTVGGSGAGIVVLKKLDEALADGDHIYAVIKGTAINNDGGAKVGYTAPRAEGQAKVIRDALRAAEVEPRTIGYIETHGTGTQLGDPIEITALTRAFRAGTDEKQFCAIGSVKTNIGHLDTAAGVVGLIKTVMALQHKQIPPSLHFTEPNPKIDFDDSPFYVNTSLSGWAANGHPRRAGVSSFGMGGTNAHIVLEEAPALAPSSSPGPCQLLVLSAKTEAALEGMTSNLAGHLKQHPELNLADVAYTLQSGRGAFNHRRTLVCSDTDDAIGALESRDQQRIVTSFTNFKQRPVIFMFPGQGTQYANMALELYQAEPTFRKHIDNCSKLLEPHLGIDLRELLYPVNENAEEAAKRLGRTKYTQPALFAVEYALAQLLMEWGARPSAMIGHSIGEYVAACLAGVFTLEEALELVAARGRMIEELAAGAMISVPLPEQDVNVLLGKDLSLAAVNGPSLSVVSGTFESVENLKQRLAEQGINCRSLRTSHAFHSAMMDPICKPFLELVKSIGPKLPQLPFVSNVTGTWIKESEATDPAYWVRHMRNTVRFAEGLQELSKEPDGVLLEVGPGQTLGGLAKQNPYAPAEQVVISTLRHSNNPAPDRAFLLGALGRLWSAGAQINWARFYGSERRQRIPLPTYPFQRHRYWIERQNPAIGAGDTASEGKAGRNANGKKADISDWFYAPSWKRTVSPSPVSLDDLKAQPSCWLIFLDESGLGDQIAERLRQWNQEVITVQAGEWLTPISDSSYLLDPCSRDDYDILIGELVGQGKAPRRIIHLWSVTAGDQSVPRAERFQKCQEMGFYSLVYLTQALSKNMIGKPVSISVVTNEAQDVTGSEELSPEKTTIFGPCKVIPQEYPNIDCTSIDIDLSELDSAQQEKAASALIAEILAGHSDSVVAYRAGRRWVQIFEPAPLDEKAGANPRLREGGVYLITGGMGQVGLALAQYLAQAARAKLILTGRSQFPEKDMWEHWLATREEDNRISQKIRVLQYIESLGAEVLTLSADVADEKQMRTVLAAAADQFGSIHGVIHAAGIIGEKSLCAIRDISRADYDRHLRPKATGLLALEELFKDKELDFCLLVSSLSSILGGLGFAGYSAANNFLDSFAQKQNRASARSWISIIWDGWNFTRAAEDQASAPASRIDTGMTAEEGTETFRRVISSGNMNQAVISTSDLQERINQWIKLQSLKTERKAESEALLPVHTRPELSSSFIAPRNELESTLADIWCELLGIERVGIEDNFFELGGHSLLAIQLISRVRDLFQVELPVEALFESPTIKELGMSVIQGQFGQVEGESMPDILAEIELLSEDEARSMLADGLSPE